MEPQVITVNSPSPYAVTIGRGLFPQIQQRIIASGAQKVAIVVAPPLRERAVELQEQLSRQGLEVHTLDIPDAELAKEISVVASLWDDLGTQGFSRSDIVIAIGGGATTDMAGFVAASWMRGIRVIHVPTTLLAMVDAAVGGKTGINTASGKNMVGAFHEPDSVFVDMDFLETLPHQELVSGSAEIIKAGFIADPSIIHSYEKDPSSCLDTHGLLPELITKAISIKATVVGQDLKESGLRETLNYGHTFGHAIELAENYTWRHGNAVAVGMLFVAHLAHQVGLLQPSVVVKHQTVLENIGLPTSYSGADFETLLEFMKRDKKNRGGGLRFVALTKVGETTRLENPAQEELITAWQKIAG